MLTLFNQPVGDNAKLKKAREVDIRWQRIVGNDVECIPLGLIIAWASLLSPFSAKVHCGLIITFAVSRALHSLTYALELQPHRALCWMVSIFSIIFMAANGVGGFMY